MSYESIKEHVERGDTVLGRDTYLTRGMFNYFRLKYRGTDLVRFAPWGISFYGTGGHTEGARTRINLAFELMDCPYRLYSVGDAWRIHCGTEDDRLFNLGMQIRSD